MFLVFSANQYANMMNMINISRCRSADQKCHCEHVSMVTFGSMHRCAHVEPERAASVDSVIHFYHICAEQRLHSTTTSSSALNFSSSSALNFVTHKTKRVSESASYFSSSPHEVEFQFGFGLVMFDMCLMNNIQCEQRFSFVCIKN